MSTTQTSLVIEGLIAGAVDRAQEDCAGAVRRFGLGIHWTRESYRALLVDACERDRIEGWVSGTQPGDDECRLRNGGWVPGG
jgi:hypothetical protein